MSYDDWGYRHVLVGALRRDVVHALVGGLADLHVDLGCVEHQLASAAPGTASRLVCTTAATVAVRP
jgi:hypothetical protein